MFSGGPLALDQLWAHVNRLPLGPARSITPFPGAPLNTWVATFTVPTQALRDGLNKVMIRNEANLTLTVVSIDIRIRS